MTLAEELLLVLLLGSTYDIQWNLYFIIIQQKVYKLGLKSQYRRWQRAAGVWAGLLLKQNVYLNVDTLLCYSSTLSFNMPGFIRRKHTSKPAMHHFTPSYGNISLSLETVAKCYMLLFRFWSDAVLLFADLQMTAQIIFQLKCKNNILMYLFAEWKESSRNAAMKKQKQIVQMTLRSL